MNRITSVVFAGIAGFIVIQQSPKLRMAAGAACITMADAVCRRTTTATGGVTTDHPLADQRCGLISVAAETRRDTLRQIRGSKRGTTARRITLFRTGYVNHIEDAKWPRPFPACRRPRFKSRALVRLHLPSPPLPPVSGTKSPAEGTEHGSGLLALPSEINSCQKFSAWLPWPCSFLSPSALQHGNHARALALSSTTSPAISFSH